MNCLQRAHQAARVRKSEHGTDTGRTFLPESPVNVASRECQPSGRQGSRRKVVDHREAGAVGTDAKEGSRSVGATTTSNTQKERSIGKTARGQGEHQKTSQGPQTVRLDEPAQFAVGTRLRGHRKNDTGSIGGGGCYLPVGSYDLSHRPRPVGRRTVIHTARFSNQRSRRLRG